MVNLEKWDEVEHSEVKVGDLLKIVWTKEFRDHKRTEVHKAKVTRIDGDDFYLSNGTCWSDGKPHKGTTCDLYRRKPKAFEFPTGVGAIIEADGSPRGRFKLVNLGGGRWFSIANNGTYSQSSIAMAKLINLRTISEGVTL